MLNKEKYSKNTFTYKAWLIVCHSKFHALLCLINTVSDSLVDRFMCMQLSVK